MLFLLRALAVSSWTPGCTADARLDEGVLGGGCGPKCRHIVGERRLHLAWSVD